MSVIKLPVTREQKASKPEPAAIWHPLQSLQREINQIFDQFDRGWRPFSQRSIFDIEPFGRVEAAWSSPAIDVLETDKAYEVTAEVPGMAAENLEVKLDNSRLIIRGEKKESKEEKRGDSQLSERRYGAFERMFTIPEGVDTAKIDATLKAGVLTVHLPKTVEAQKAAKTIQVKAA